MKNELENGEVRTHASAYRTLSVIFFLLAAGGLFLGLLQSVSGYFVGKLYAVVTSTTVPADFQGSLFAYIWVVFENLFNGGSAGLVLWQYLELVLVFLVVISVVVSLICLITAMCSKKAAKKSALVSGVLVAIAYTFLALIANFIGSTVTGSFAIEMFDLPLTIISAV